MKKNKHWRGVYAVLLASACASLWLHQQSIETYWQQQYHRASPLARLQAPWWQSGRAVREQIDIHYQYAENRVRNWADDALASLLPVPAVSTAFAAKPLDIAQIDISQALAALEQYAAEKYVADKRAQKQQKQQKQGRPRQQQVQTANDSALRTATLSGHSTTDTPTVVASLLSTSATSSALTKQTARAQQEQQSSKQDQSAAHSTDKITLKAGDNVLFIGDSMMQSFAPKMQKWLKKQHNINSINMGRHSTGLTNQGYFDWPKKAETSIKAKKNLKLVVVFLGANDAWNMKVSKKVLRFNSPQWVNAYSERMMRIVRAAQAKNAQVIWIGLPYMRSKKYSKKIVALDNIMRQALNGEALYIPIRSLLSGKNQQYRDSLKINGKWRRVRHKDGIHLNAQGELKVLEAIKPYIHFE